MVMEMYELWIDTNNFLSSVLLLVYPQIYTERIFIRRH